jgi:hypothetical protein
MSDDHGSTGQGQAPTYTNAQAVSWARRQKLENASQAAALLVLAAYADEYGRCWPSQETIALETSQSVKSVERALARLEGLGKVVRTKRSKGRGGGRRSDLIKLVGFISKPDSQPDRLTGSNSPTRQIDGLQDVQPDNLSVTTRQIDGGTKQGTKQEAASSGGTVIETPTQVIMGKIGCTEQEAAAVIDALKQAKAERGQKIRSLRGLLNHMPPDELRELLPQQAKPKVYIDYSKCPREIADDGAAYAAWCREQRALALQAQA